MKPRRTADGRDLITSCHGCAAWPVRQSWLTAACKRCGVEVCIECEKIGCKCPSPQCLAPTSPAGTRGQQDGRAPASTAEEA